MKIDIDYGKQGLSVALPDDLDITILRKPQMPVISDPRDAINTALNEPVACGALSELARDAQSACIAICDITRPVPNHLFLRPMIETLLDSGMSADAITVIIATGLHRPNLGDELAELIGDPWVTEHVNVVNHYARDDAMHVDLGKTLTRGTRVKLDKRFVDADLRIATGLVEPHFMAGYSGGRKVIAPGLAHAETITTFHNAQFMGDECARNCNLDGNPLHEEQLEIVKMLGSVYALNTVIDENRALSFVNFGEVVASHLAAVSEARRTCEVDVTQRFSTVLTSCAGYPLDKTYYQTVKGMVAPVDILEPSGDLIIVSECSEGMGSAEYVEAQKRLISLGVDQFLQTIRTQTHAEIDEWQTQMQTKPMALGQIHLYSDQLDKSQAAHTGVNLIDDVVAAVIQSTKRSGDKRVAVIPEGPYVIPVYRPELVQAA